MTHLNIQQGLNIEVVSTKLIQKLYEAALSVPKPLEGELDAAYMSGNLLVDKSYRSLVEYLTNRFDDLHINVTGGYYIPFRDNAVNNVLKDTIGDGVGVLESLLKAANPKDSELGLANNTSIVDTTELCLIEGIDVTGGFLTGCSNIKTIGIPCNTTTIQFNTRSTVDNIVVKNIKNFLNAWIPYSYNFYRNQSGWDLYTTVDGSNILKVETLTIPSGVTFLDNNEYAPLYKCKSVTTLNVPNTLNTLGGCRYSYLLNLTFEPNSTLSKICANAFEQCTNLSLDVSTLPSTITTIKESAFLGCSNITGILNLPNLTSLEQNAFLNTGITSIADLGSVTSIPNSCFREASIQSISIPNGISLVGDFAFLTSKVTITSIDIPTSINSIGMVAFGEINSLSSCIYLPNITSVGNNVSYYAFCHVYLGLYSTIGLMYFPNLTTTGSEGYGTDRYRHGLFCSIRSNLVYLKNISDLYPGAFSWSNIDAIVINNDNPPILRDSTTTSSEVGGQTVSIFNDMGTYNSNTHTSTWGGFIYVPDNAVAAYLTWANNINGISSSKIKSMNELPRFATKDAWVLGGRQIGLIEEYM